MRTAEDYKKLVEGYKFSLSILKVVSNETFQKFIKAKDLLDTECAYSRLVCELKIHFINEQDDLECTSFKTLEDKENNEIYEMFFLPSDEYTLSLTYEKVNIFGGKKYIFEIVPTSLSSLNENSTCALRFAVLNKNGMVVKSLEYHVLLLNNILEIVKRTGLKFGKYKDEKILNISLEKLEEIQNELENTF